MYPRLYAYCSKTENQAAGAENVNAPAEDDKHKTTVRKLSVAPWVETGEILAASNSHFYYVQREKVLEDVFLVLIGVVKKTPRRFPMAYLQSIDFTCRVDFYVLMSEESN